MLGIEQPRRIHREGSFTANAKVNNSNDLDLDAGTPNNFRMERIELRGLLRITASGATDLRFLTRAERNALFDAWVSRIELRSSAFGQPLIEPMSLSELIQIVEDFSGIMPESDLPTIGFAQTLGTTGQLDFELVVSIPWVFKHSAHVGPIHAPMTSWFGDGGLGITYGAGTFTADGTAWTINGANSELEVRIWGREMSRLQRVTPFRYIKRQINQRSKLALPAGLYYSLRMEDGASVTPRAIARGGISYGVAYHVNGNEAINMSDFDALGFTVRHLHSLFDRTALKHDLNVHQNDGEAPWDRPGLILLNTPSSARPGEINIFRSLHFDVGDSYTLPLSFKGVFVEPITTLGPTPKGCGCGSGEAWATFPPPGLTKDDVPAEMGPFLPQSKEPVAA